MFPRRCRSVKDVLATIRSEIKVLELDVDANKSFIKDPVNANWRAGAEINVRYQQQKINMLYQEIDIINKRFKSVSGVSNV